MLRNRLYYGTKPFLPVRLRRAVRGLFARRARPGVADVWPIAPGSEKAPEGWPGWPDGKKFAVILTHDVEGQRGFDNIQNVIDLEKSLEFRSSFNLIPEGGYHVTPEIRKSITDQGFEVGVHDLRHDGKLFRNQQDFAKKADKINRYLKEWGATGFRAGFMLHNLDWIHHLNVAYDLSTFDTDPFEPQPYGQHTIFPFWVPRPNQLATCTSHLAPPPRGYVEMPYTLPQDHTVFLLLKEQHPDIWMHKVDWIAQHGGMVLLDSHPDYMSFTDKRRDWQYPADLYKQLLQYIKKRYVDEFWHPLPGAVSEFVKTHAVSKQTFHPRAAKRAKIWIDLDNTPHVPFFEPILEELKARGYPLLVTARDAFQVCDLADKKGLPYIKVGKHYGKNRLAKASGLAYRALQLAPLIRRERPALAVSHGARSQLMLCNWLRIPTLLIEDYEYCQFPPMMRPTYLMAPAVIPDSMLLKKNGNLLKYPGIKEDVYAWRLKPDISVLQQLGIGESDLLITVRPPATEAHYHNPESEILFKEFMDRACGTSGARIVLLPRNKKQAEWIRAQWPGWFDANKTIIPKGALDGMNLIWHSDLVVSGGGTMNREAAALGVPVYSIFRGAIGAVDRHLKAEQKLVLLESVKDVQSKINLEKRPRKAIGEVTSRTTLESIVDSIEQLAQRHAR